MLHLVRGVLIVVFATVLVGCGLPFGGSMTVEQAVDEALSRDPSMPLLTEPETRVSRRLPTATVVLVTYESEYENKRMLVENSMMLERQGLGWWSSGSGSTWYPLDEPMPPISFGAGSTSSDGGLSYAQASGLVTDPAVHEVAVTWSDGSREVVAVENGAYLAARTGTATVANIEALDEQGNVVHQSDFNEG